MNWKLTPAEPTPEMIAECQGERENHPVLKYLTPEERSGPLLPLALYRASISAAPDPLSDAELVERVARAICDSTEMDAYDELSEESVVKALYRQQARAAITAMKG